MSWQGAAIIISVTLTLGWMETTRIRYSVRPRGKSPEGGGEE